MTFGHRRTRVCLRGEAPNYCPCVQLTDAIAADRLADTRSHLVLLVLLTGVIVMRRRPTSNRNFRPTARRVAAPNRWVPMRGGIRF